MPGDGSCLLHSLLHSLKPAIKLDGATKMREQMVTWLRANPNHPFLDATLADFVLGETGEQWSAYCNRMQHEHVWGGIPELVAAAQIYRICIRVFANVGLGRFHLRAVLGEVSTLLDTSIPWVAVTFAGSRWSVVVGVGMRARCAAALMTVVGEMVLRVLCGRARASCVRAASFAGLAACGVALAAAGSFLIVLLGELCGIRDDEKVVGKLSFVGFFVRPGWL